MNCESVNIAAVADGGEEREEENTPPKKNCELWKLWNFVLSVRDEVLIVYR